MLETDNLDGVITVSNEASVAMSLRLAREEGILCGISSGANLIGAMQRVEATGGDAVVVTILCDSNKKYLSTDLCREEPVRDGYWAPRVELLGFRAIADPG